MRKSILVLELATLSVCFLAVLKAFPSEIDGQLNAKRRVFPSIGPGLREIRRTSSGNYYVLASPAVGVAIFDQKGKPLAVVGAPSESPSATTSTTRDSWNWWASLPSQASASELSGHATMSATSRAAPPP